MAVDIERLLDALRAQESGGNRFAVSKKGAMGAYQFMPKTAKEFGLYGSDVYDEGKARGAARKKLSGLIGRYGLEGGIAAYNMGEGNLEKNGGNWRAFKETRDYVPSVLAKYQGQGGNLRQAGFRRYGEEQYPIVQIPGVEPQEPIMEANDMPVTKQTPSGKVVDFAKQQKGVNRQKLIAQALSKVNWQDPYAQAGGRTVAIHPLTALANGLQNYMALKAGMEAKGSQDQLEVDKSQALQDMFNSGQQPDLAQMAQSGLVGTDALAEALVKRQSQQQSFMPIRTSKGWALVDRATGDVRETGYKDPLYDMEAQRGLIGQREALKGGQYDIEGHPVYGPAYERNPGAYGQFVQPMVPQGQPQPSYDYPTGFAGNPGQSPNPSAQPVQPAQPIQMGQSPAEKAASIKQAEQPYNIGEAAAKQEIENNAKIDLERKKTALDLPKIKANAEYTKSLIDEISSHPGLSSMVGVPNPLVGGFGDSGALPGTDAAGFKAKMEQLKGKQFLEAYETLKGGGQITEMEGAKAEKAIAALSTAQKEEDFKRELAKLKEVIDAGYGRAFGKAGNYSELPVQPSRPAKKSSKDMSDDELLNYYGQ